MEAEKNVWLAGLVDSFAFVPGYVLLSTAVFAMLRSRVGPLMIFAATVADQIENVMVQIALRGFDGVRRRLRLRQRSLY